MGNDERMKGMNREQRRQLLRQQSKQRQQQMGAPNFGLSEKKMLQQAQTLEELRVSNNKVVTAIQELNDKNIVDKTIESHYMMSVICEMLIEKGVFTKEELQARCEAVQVQDLGLIDKAPGSVAESGDHMLIKFKLFDGDKLVDSQWDAPLAYVPGLPNPAFTCEDGMLGMKVGEVRTLTTTFGQGFKFKEYVGKPLTIQLACVGLKVLDPARHAPQNGAGRAATPPQPQPTM